MCNAHFHDSICTYPNLGNYDMSKCYFLHYRHNIVDYVLT